MELVASKYCKLLLLIAEVDIELDGNVMVPPDTVNPLLNVFNPVTVWTLLKSKNLELLIDEADIELSGNVTVPPDTVKPLLNVFNPDRVSGPAK